jgi:hypothetical protein
MSLRLLKLPLPPWGGAGRGLIKEITNMKKMNHHNISAFTIKSIIVGSYVWLATISFGLVLLDIVYAGLVPDASVAFREAADFLLFINTLTILTAFGAIGSSIDTKVAKNYFIASLVVIIMGFLINAALSSNLENSSHIGAVIRILLNGSVSILAFTGFYMYCREPLIKISYI